MLFVEPTPANPGCPVMQPSYSTSKFFCNILSYALQHTHSLFVAMFSYSPQVHLKIAVNLLIWTYASNVYFINYLSCFIHYSSHKLTQKHLVYVLIPWWPWTWVLKIFIAKTDTTSNMCDISVIKYSELFHLFQVLSTELFHLFLLLSTIIFTFAHRSIYYRKNWLNILRPHRPTAD